MALNEFFSRFFGKFKGIETNNKHYKILNWNYFLYFILITLFFIVFMLLFFFMVATVMREVDLKVTVNKPQATEIQKLERKSLVTYIYAGAPRMKYQDKFGRSPRVQLNDAFASLDDIQPFVIQEREQKSEEDAAMMTMSIKADKTVKMGLITDIK